MKLAFLAAALIAGLLVFWFWEPREEEIQDNGWRELEAVDSV